MTNSVDMSRIWVFIGGTGLIWLESGIPCESSVNCSDEFLSASDIFNFQVWLRCSRYHYYLLIWRYLSTYGARYLRVYIKFYWKDLLFTLKWFWNSVNIAVNTRTLPDPLVWKFPQTDVFCRVLGDSPENLRKLLPRGKYPHQEIRRS